MRFLLSLSLVGLFVLHILPAYGQVSRGTVKEGLTIQSEVLGKPVRYTVYLPYDYDTSSRHYPVVYLLHGYTDDDTAWLQFGEAHMIADEGIARREIPPMILVMPDAGVSWYVNNHDGSVAYEDFFIEELIPHIESTYRVRTQRRYRGVAGLSMGGYGALVYALRHPDLFSAAAAFSAAVYTDEETVQKSEARWARTESVVYGPGLQGEERLTEHYKSYSPLHIVRRADPDTFKGLRLYLDCGDDDFLYRGNAAMHTLLRSRGIDHEYRVRDGGHQWSYWRSGLLEGLKFIGASFRP